MKWKMSRSDTGKTWGERNSEEFKTGNCEALAYKNESGSKDYRLVGRRKGYSEFFEFGAGAAVFLGTGIALDDFAEFSDAARLLV